MKILRARASEHPSNFCEQIEQRPKSCEHLNIVRDHLLSLIILTIFNEGTQLARAVFNGARNCMGNAKSHLARCFIRKKREAVNSRRPSYNKAPITNFLDLPRRRVVPPSPPLLYHRKRAPKQIRWCQRTPQSKKKNAGISELKKVRKLGETLDK